MGNPRKREGLIRNSRHSVNEILGFHKRIDKILSVEFNETLRFLADPSRMNAMEYVDYRKEVNSMISQISEIRRLL